MSPPDPNLLARAALASAANHEAAYREGWNAALAALDDRLRRMRYVPDDRPNAAVEAVASAGFGIAICEVGLAVRALAKEPPDA